MNLINEKAFKTYDIRGVYGKEIDENLAYEVGRAFVSFLKKESPSIVMGRDGRFSSPALFKEIKRGVIEAGGNVVNIGVSNTPLLNFAVANFKYDGGIMVTASHNPPEFNGFKLIKEKALQVYGEEIQEIKEIIKKEKTEEKKEKGKEEEKSVLSEYLDKVSSTCGDLEDIKIVVDCGNGAGPVTAKPFFERKKANTHFLYEEMDSSFPNHLPDPFDKKALNEVKETVLREGADLGAIFDGDGDRCVLIDEKGEFISTDTLLSLIVSETLADSGEKEVYYDLRFSMATAEGIKKAGGNPVVMRVGNPFYKEKIIKEGGLVGAELSGHIMFKEHFGIDDGLFALVKLLSILENKEKPLSELLSPFKRYHQTEEINMEVKNKEKALEAVETEFSDGEALNIDGVYIKYDNWWFNLRKSNTEDLVRLRVEAKEKKLLEEKKEKIISLIKKT